MQDATADASPLVHGKATEAHAALATPLAVNAESAPADAASAEAAAAAQMALVAAVARHLHEEDCKSAGIDSRLQSDEAMVAQQAAILADIGQLHRRAKLHPITTFSQPSPLASYEENFFQLEFEQAVANSLGECAYVGKRVPLEPGQELTKAAHMAACRASSLMCGLSKVRRTMWHGCVSEQHT